MLSHTSIKQLEKRNRTPHTAAGLEERAVLAVPSPPAALCPASLKSTWQDHAVGREEAGSLSESLDKQPTRRGSADDGGWGGGGRREEVSSSIPRTQKSTGPEKPFTRLRLSCPLASKTSGRGDRALAQMPSGAQDAAVREN